MKHTPFEKEQLRRWCIEMALSWPTITDHVGNMMGGGISRTTDADVIGRAQKIEDWVAEEEAA